jgi:HEPN domain-containing protein
LETGKYTKLGVDRAGRWLRSAELALKEGRHDDVVYCSQMCVELSTKAVLLATGIDYPKDHDISGVFIELSAMKTLPEWFRKRVPVFTRYISELAEQRGLAGYGFEQGVEPDYFKDYSSKAFQYAKEVHESCAKLLRTRR